MNGATLKGSGLGTSVQESADDQERVSDEERAVWTHVLANVPAQVVDHSALVSDNEAPNPWRSTDGALTAGPRGAAVGGGENRNAADTATRMRLSIDAGRYGKLSLGLAKTAEGTRVVLGVEDDSALSALSAGKTQLVQALASAGVKVSSVSMVSASEVGILLARLGEKPPADDKRSGSEATPSRNTESRRRNKKLDLTG